MAVHKQNMRTFSIDQWALKSLVSEQGDESQHERKHSEELNFTQSGLQQLVVGHYGIMGDVEMAGDAAQVCHL